MSEHPDTPWPEPAEPLRLFVWSGVLVDYTDGLMVAMAASVEDARAMLRQKFRADGLTGGPAGRDNGKATDLIEADLAKVPTEYDGPACAVVWGGG